MSKTMANSGLIVSGGVVHAEKETKPLGNYWKVLIPIAAGAVLLLLPVPEGLKPYAWYYFALFVAVIIGLILEPIPAAAVGLIGVTAATITPWVAAKPADSIKWALSGFQDGTVWLIFVAFMFALGYEKTGLGRRVALNLVKWWVRELSDSVMPWRWRTSRSRRLRRRTPRGAAVRFFR